MATFDTNVLNTAITDPDVLYTSLISRFADTFFTTTSAISAANFLKVPTLSAVYSAGISINTNISDSAFTTIVTAMPTASANSSKTPIDTRTIFLTSVGVTHVEFISAGTVNGNGSEVYGIAFNKLSPELTSVSTSTTLLSVYNGIKLSVNNAYNGTTMSVVLKDRSAYEFVVDISKAQTSGQSLTAANSDTPERRRLWTLGYI